LFIAAGLAEIGGGYLVWRWLRDGAPVIVGILGAIILVLCGTVPALQKSSAFPAPAQAFRSARRLKLRGGNRSPFTHMKRRLTR